VSSKKLIPQQNGDEYLKVLDLIAFFIAPLKLNFLKKSMFRFLTVSTVLLITFSLATSANLERSLCLGFAPKNDLKIPVSLNSKLQSSGLNESEFNKTLDRIEIVYKKIINDKHGRLFLNRYWQSPTVNASALRAGDRYLVNVFGGIARHPRTTPDVLAL